MKKYGIILSILLLTASSVTVVKAQQEDPFEQLYKQATDNVYTAIQPAARTPSRHCCSSMTFTRYQ